MENKRRLTDIIGNIKKIFKPYNYEKDTIACTFIRFYIREWAR